MQLHGNMQQPAFGSVYYLPCIKGTSRQHSRRRMDKLVKNLEAEGKKAAWFSNHKTPYLLIDDKAGSHATEFLDKKYLKFKIVRPAVASSMGWATFPCGPLGEGDDGKVEIRINPHLGFTKRKLMAVAKDYIFDVFLPKTLGW